jgi:hypothetical protein
VSLTSCPDCGQSISDLAPACIHCGRPRNLAVSPETASLRAGRTPALQSMPGRESAVLTSFPLFPVATHKFIVLSLVSFTAYTFYWFYQNWKRIKTASQENLSPFWRTAFAPLWGFSLFSQIRILASAQGIAADWSPGLLGTMFLVLNSLWILPDPWSWISLAVFVPAIPIQQTAQRVNEICAKSVGEPQNDTYTAGNVAMIVIGGLVLTLAIMGSFMPDLRPLPVFTIVMR